MAFRIGLEVTRNESGDTVKALQDQHKVQ